MLRCCVHRASLRTSMRLLVDDLLGQLHQLLGKVHIVRLRATFLGNFRRCDIQATFHASCGSIHGADATLKLTLAEWLQAHAHAVSEQWVWLVDVLGRLCRFDDTRVYCVCEDIGVLRGQVARQVLCVQQDCKFGATILRLGAVVLLQFVDVHEGSLFWAVGVKAR